MITTQPRFGVGICLPASCSYASGILGWALTNGTISACKVVFLTDMHKPEQSLAMLRMNGIMAQPCDVINSNFTAHGEACKAMDCLKHEIDLHIDDFPGYIAAGATVRLLVMPDIQRPYYADNWKTDGSEGDFGRRKKS